MHLKHVNEVFSGLLPIDMYGLWSQSTVLPATAAAASLRFCTGLCFSGSSTFCSVNNGALKGFARASWVSVVGYMSDGRPE